MKQTLLSVVFCCLSALLQAQSSFPTTDSLSINNINATFMVHGDMWNGPDTVGSHCYFPSSTRKSVCAAGALWMSGYVPIDYLLVFI